MYHKEPLHVQHGIPHTIEFKNVSYTYDGEKDVLDHVSLDVGKGKKFALVGPSGGGKTTLFNLIAGIKMPDEGKIYLDGEEITGKPGNVSYMLQKDLMLPYRTIVDNVALPLLVNGMKKKEGFSLLFVIYNTVLYYVIYNKRSELKNPN